jgi:AcrR family transcriptional regulator
LDVAKGSFTRHGADASLDDIAKQAGVGPGTLYRHFPTRDVLIEAVYRSEVEKLAAAEWKFSGTMPPISRVTNVDVAVRRPHRGEADHRPRGE